jgi:predicted alpha/beta-hydrolase family hydrolase
VRGLVFLGYPLHLAKKPAIKRAEHLPRVPMPMSFLQGTRDALADLKLLRPILKKVPNAELHIVDGADHGFAVLKRSGRTESEVLHELASSIAAFVDETCA